MVAFYLPETGLNTMDEDLMRSMNLGDCTISNGFLQVDLRGDNPAFTKDELNRIEKAGLVRADTNWYEISPEPLREQQGKLLEAFGARPSTTMPPSDDQPHLRFSFVEALSDEQTQKIEAMGFKVEKIETQPIPTW